MTPKITLDLNVQVFQRDWFALEKEDVLAIFSTLRKIQQMDWAELYRDHGLHWEKIRSGPEGFYTIRITRRVRAVCRRDANILRFMAIHPDHDSAYKK